MRACEAFEIELSCLDEPSFSDELRRHLLICPSCQELRSFSRALGRHLREAVVERPPRLRRDALRRTARASSNRAKRRRPARRMLRRMKKPRATSRAFGLARIAVVAALYLGIGSAMHAWSGRGDRTPAPFEVEGAVHAKLLSDELLAARALGGVEAFQRGR